VSVAVLAAAAALFFSYHDAFAAVTSAVWDDPDNSDRVLSNGDTLTITFDQNTDRPGGTGVQNKARVDSMFDFEGSLGANYTGQWTGLDEFTITIVDATGGTTIVGDDVFRQSESFRIFQLDTAGGTAFSSPIGVATNSTDFIFVSDGINTNVQIFRPDGTYSGVNLSGGAFADPQGVATNSTDFIFVVDNNNDNVQIFRPDGTYSGVNLSGGAFASPFGVATNSTDFIFVSDQTNDNVQIFRPDGTFSGSTLSGGAFNLPRGIATNSTGFIFVGDIGNSNVQIFRPDGTYSGVNLSGTAFDSPFGVATNSTDFIFVSDANNNNVQIFRPDGTFAAAQPTTGGTAFSNPNFIAVDSDDRLLVPDSVSDIVQVFGPASVQNAAQTALVFTNTQVTAGNLGLATLLTGVVADDPDDGDNILSAGDTLVFSFDFATNATAGGTMTLAEINANFTFGAKTIGSAASGVWDTNQQLTITINSNDGTILVGDSVEPSTDIADSTGEALISGMVSITGNFGLGSAPSSDGGGGGGGDSTPPSFTTGFSAGEPVLEINGDSFAAKDLDSGTQGTIQARQGQTVSFDVSLYDDGGAGNIRHIDLFLNKQGDRILNDLTETYLTWDEGQTTLHDPAGIIQSYTITKTTQGNKAVFSFGIVFSSEMGTSDILIQAWDLRRNVVYLHANDIISVISEPAGTKQQTMPEQTIPE